MRILYIDIDSLRADHLGCYGYRRDTSPNIDNVAAQGIRFDNFYVSDTPCLPSRTALFGGRFGIHNGLCGHGGTAADPFLDGPPREFQSDLSRTCWMTKLRRCGYHTATISSFAERHSAWHFYAGFSEICNPGRCGMERADEVGAIALDWLERNGASDNWFLHVNFWDPHTPYRTPANFPNIFANDPLPSWLTEEARQMHWNSGGPHSAREVQGFDGLDAFGGAYPLQPTAMASMDDVRAMFDGYDLGVRYADEYIGRILGYLADLGVRDETAIIISADHGENLGELNIYGDHQTADHITARVPLIISWPNMTQAGTVDKAFHYHVDLAPTVVELAGGTFEGNWDAQSFAATVKGIASGGRPLLILSQGAWSCQRSVRWKNFLCLRTLDDGLHAFPETMLFDVETDPHEQHDLAPDYPDLVAEAINHLDEWTVEMMRTSTQAVDPLWTIIREGGPYQTRGALRGYLARLRETGRTEFADRLAANHRLEIAAFGE